MPNIRISSSEVQNNSADLMDRYCPDTAPSGLSRHAFSVHGRALNAGSRLPGVHLLRSTGQFSNQTLVRNNYYLCSGTGTNVKFIRKSRVGSVILPLWSRDKWIHR